MKRGNWMTHGVLVNLTVFPTQIRKPSPPWLCFLGHGHVPATVLYVKLLGVALCKFLLQAQLDQLMALTLTSRVRCKVSEERGRRRRGDSVIRAPQVTWNSLNSTGFAQTWTQTWALQRAKKEDTTLIKWTVISQEDNGSQTSNLTPLSSRPQRLWQLQESIQTSRVGSHGRNWSASGS